MTVADLCRGIGALAAVVERDSVDRAQVCVMLRWPGLESAAWSRRIEQVVGPIRAAGFRLGIDAGARQGHEEVDAFLRQVAVAEPDLLQLPERAAPPSVWRARLSHHVGRIPLIGRSCHDVRGLSDAFDRGADYAWLSPIFATPSKPSAAAMGTVALGLACRQQSRPVIALGGVDGSRVGACLAAGAYGVACIRAAWGQEVFRLVRECLVVENVHDSLER